MTAETQLMLNINGLQASLECAGKRHICTSRLDNASGDWILGATDGINVWSRCISKDDYQNLLDKHSLTSEQCSSLVKAAFACGNLQLSTIAQKVKVVIQNSAHTLSLPFDLYETTSLEKSTEIKHLLFSMMDTITDQGKELKDIKEQLSSAEKPSNNAPEPRTHIFGELESKRSKRSVPKQQKGHSVINPGSKRLKEAKGIVFE